MHHKERRLPDGHLLVCVLLPGIRWVPGCRSLKMGLLNINNKFKHNTHSAMPWYTCIDVEYIVQCLHFGYKSSFA